MSYFLHRRQLLLVLAFLVALLITGMFAVRAAHHVPSLLGPEVDEPIRPWMSVPYIAHSYHVPPPVLFEALGLPPGVRDRRPIMQIAREQGRPVDAVIADLMQAIDEFRPPPPPMPPPTPTPPRTL